MPEVKDINGRLVQVITKKYLERYVADNIESQLTYAELYSAENEPAAGGGGSAWHDWDLSAIVPEGTKYAEILCTQGNSGTQYCGVRKNGSALLRLLGYANTDTTITVEVDSNRIIEGSPIYFSRPNGMV